MKSFAVIDRLEDNIAVCEVELLPIQESKAEDFETKETEMMDICLEQITNIVGDIQESDVIIVEHNSEEILDVYCKDEDEKEKRVKLLKKILGA